MRRRNPVWYTGRKDDLGLRAHPWTAFDGNVIDSPIWLSPDKGFAKANAGYHGFVYTVEFEPRKLFPQGDLVDYSGRTWGPTEFGREVLEELERGRIFPKVGPDDAWEVLKDVDRGDYDTMETGAMVGWLKTRGYDSMVVTGDGPVNVAVFDPAAIRVVSVEPATPGHDQANCVGCRKTAMRNPPDPRQPPHGGTTKRVEKAAIYRHKACEKRLGRKVVWRPTFVVDVEKWKVPGKWGPESRSRASWWAVHPSTGREYAFEGPPQTPCPECGQLVSGDPIKGVKNDAIPCTAKCVAAVGPSCECTCAGANHGAAHGGARANPPSQADTYRERWERTGDAGHGLRYVTELEKGAWGSGELWQFSHAADVYERLAQIYEAAGNERMFETVKRRLEEIAPDLNARFVKCGLCATWFFVGSEAGPRRRARTLSNHMAVCTERTPAERVFYKRERKWPQNREFWRAGGETT